MADSTTAGDYEPGTAVYQQKKHTTAIAKGDLLVLDGTSHGWKTAPTTATVGPYAVATKAQLAGDVMASVVTDGIVYLVADGAINPGDMVVPSATTAGRVISYVATVTPSATTATSEFLRPCGIYIGHVDEGGGTTAGNVQTAAAAGEVVRIDFEGVA